MTADCENTNSRDLAGSSAATSRERLVSFAVYRFSRTMTVATRGERFYLSVSATPNQPARFAVTIGRASFEVSVGRTVTRETPGTERGYKHTRFSFDISAGWVNRV